MQLRARRRSVNDEPLGVMSFVRPTWALHRSPRLPATALASAQPDSTHSGGGLPARHTARGACAAAARLAHAHRRQRRSSRATAEHYEPAEASLELLVLVCCTPHAYARSDCSQWPATGRLPRAVSCVGGAAPPPQPTSCGGDYFFGASEGARQPRPRTRPACLHTLTRTHAYVSQPPALPLRCTSRASPLQA
jgi:hypothetical protein